MTAPLQPSSPSPAPPPGGVAHGWERIKFRILVPILLAIGLLLAAFILAFRHELAGRSAEEMAHFGQGTESLLRVEQERHAATMRTTIQGLLNDGELAKRLAARDREALLARALPLFESLRLEHGITHFYFHTPDRVNLLRVHRPALNGDTIGRLTLLEAERSGRISSGMERGPIGTFVLRVVSPWIHDGVLVGYVELGVELEDIVQDVHRVLRADFVIAAYKDFIDRAEWDRTLATYGRHADWDAFPAAVVISKTVEPMPGPVVEHLRRLRPDVHGANRVAAWGERQLQLVFLPLDDMRGERLGELVLLRDVTAPVLETRSSVRFVILACAAVGAALSALFYLLLARIQADLASKTAELKQEILERQRVEAELRVAHEDLEHRVADRTSQLKKANAGLSAEIASKETAQRELETTHRQLLDISRQAGMAEVAISVLHNVGNVLNSVNVSATLVSDIVRRSKAPNLDKLCELLREHPDDLGRFLTEDPKGRMIPGYLATLSEALALERRSIVDELSNLRKNIDHIKEVVSMQQSYAKTSGVVETLAAPDLLDDALRMNAESLARHGIRVVRDYRACPPLATEKNKVLQILVNLVRNAKFACQESDRPEKVVTLRATADEHGVSLAVIDNGVGIPAENLTKIFSNGFTTRKHGHGFGLHGGALAAKELGGSLLVHSEGPGRGSTFVLRLPFSPESKSS